MGWGVVLAQPLQDELVVQQAVERPQQEDVEGQVANPLLLKVPAQGLHLPAGSVEWRERAPPTQPSRQKTLWYQLISP